MDRNRNAATLCTSLSLIAATVFAAFAMGCATTGDSSVSPVAWEMPTDRGTGGDGPA